MTYQKHKLKPQVYHIRYRINSLHGYQMCTNLKEVHNHIDMVLREGGYISAIIKRGRTDMATTPLPQQIKINK